MEEILLTRLGPALAARASGPANGRPVLALHGWLDNAASFDGLAPLLPGLRLVALDLPGHGLSAHRGEGGAYHMVDWVHDVFRAADELGWGDFTLLGHSLGAAVASLATGTRPSRIKALALIEGLGALTEEPETAPERLATHVAARERLRGKAPPVYPSVEAALAARMGAGRFDAPEGIRRVVERGLRPESGGWTWRTDPRLTLPSALRLSAAHVAAFLARVACPALLVKATHGLEIEPAAAARFRAAIPALQVVELPGGHHLHCDAPAPVAAALSAFFART